MNCRQSTEVDSNDCDMVNTDNINYITPQTVQFDSRLNSTQNDEEIRDLVLHKSPSGIISVGRPTTLMVSQRKFIIDLLSSRSNSKQSINISINALRENHMAHVQKMRNREMGNDALSLVLSALYAKFIFVLGIAFPITGIVAEKAPTTFYQGFYLFLYTVSVLFVIFVYSTHLKNRQVFTMIDHYEERTGDTKLSTKKRIIRYGSFYLRVGAIAFGIGSMVYSGLEFGQYFELKEDDRCQNLLIAVNPAARMLLTIVQMQFIFLNTKELNMTRYKVISRFGLMHLIATNLCEWIYVLVEETKHEIENLMAQHSLNLDGINATSHLIHKRATSVSIFVECKRTNIMGRLVQKAAPFLFPCTIEYSLICAVILYEMWKKIKMRDPSTREHQDSIMGHHRHKDVRQLSVDCSKAHRGMFAGILVIVLTIISLIMFYVLKEEKLYKATAVVEVTYTEILLYSVTSIAVLLAMRQMRDMKFSKLYVSGIGLDCTLLVLGK
ncbi:proton channel OtopLc-like [Chironomus tepperi]|uniref:proton channel OtopLc-like n=1 Tax=Chironomus tepperi TaxID=113505 RepID=UPI00391F70EC